MHTLTELQSELRLPSSRLSTLTLSITPTILCCQQPGEEIAHKLEIRWIRIVQHVRTV